MNMTGKDDCSFIHGNMCIVHTWVDNWKSTWLSCVENDINKTDHVAIFLREDKDIYYYVLGKPKTRTGSAVVFFLLN